jgi:tripartite-type tricarboxylate transporter receptor subunit TctC
MHEHDLTWTSLSQPATRKTFCLLTSAFCLAIAAPIAAIAQAFPAKPIRLIVPFPPGGGTDVSARLLAQAMAEGPGWQIIVENRPGATGRIGTELAAKAAPDGYTLLLGTAGPNSILPGAGAKLPYDAIKDFAPVTLVDSAAYVLVVHPSLPVRTVRDMVTLAASPGRSPLPPPAISRSGTWRPSCSSITRRST